MRLQCAECDCVVERGLRVVACAEGAACCCAELPRASAADAALLPPGP